MANLGVTIGGDIAPDKGGVGSGPLPPGDYEWEVVKSECGPAKSGNGTVAEFEADGVGADNKGAKLWFRLNVQNKSAQAQAIGQAQLQALKISCGLEADFDLVDTEQVHHRPFWARTKPDTYTGKDGQEKTKNELVKILYEGCDDREEGAAAAPAAKPEPKPSTPAASTPKPAGSRPWAKK